MHRLVGFPTCSNPALVSLRGNFSRLACAQVWQDALDHKAQSPYMRHTLAGGALRNFHFCPYEVRSHLLWPETALCQRHNLRISRLGKFLCGNYGIWRAVDHSETHEHVAKAVIVFAVCGKTQSSPLPDMHYCAGFSGRQSCFPGTPSERPSITPGKS